MQTLFSCASIPITQLILSILIVSVPPFIMGRHSYLCLSSELKSAIHSHSLTSIKPAMMYDAKYWAIKGQHIQKMSVAEMRMLRWICGYTTKDRIRNDDIRDKLGVTPIQEKLVQHRL
jgi:hypothetical protein